MEIVSTMGTGSFGRELELETLVAALESHLDSSVDANFTSNGMVTIRLVKGGPAFTVYRTGSFQVRGAKTEDRLFEVTNRFRSVLGDIGVMMPNYEFAHVTSVFMEDLDREVNLEILAVALGIEDTEYEPEQFPGLIYRPPGFELTLLVFYSGKIIIGGTTNREEASAAIDGLLDELVAVDNT